MIYSIVVLTFTQAVTLYLLIRCIEDLKRFRKNLIELVADLRETQEAQGRSLYGLDRQVDSISNYLRNQIG